MYEILAIYGLLGSIYSIYFMLKVKRSSSENVSLSTSEKIQAITTLLLAPIIAIIVYYFGWRKTFPKKVEQLILYFIFIFLFEFLLISTYWFIFAISFNVIDPVPFIDNFPLKTSDAKMTIEPVGFVSQMAGYLCNFFCR